MIANKDILFCFAIVSIKIFKNNKNRNTFVHLKKKKNVKFNFKLNYFHWEKNWKFFNRNNKMCQ